jgi:hypothetical protein
LYNLLFRGFLEDDFRKVIAFVDEAVKIAQIVQTKTTKLKEFQVRFLLSKTVSIEVGKVDRSAVLRSRSLMILADPHCAETS